jgi:hypothetical protein
MKSKHIIPLMLVAGVVLVYVLWRNTGKSQAALTAAGIARYGTTDYQAYQGAGF